MNSLKKTITTIIITIIAIFGLSFLLTSTSYAVVSNICDSEASSEVKAANGCDGDGGGDLQNTIVGIINGIVGILAAIAAIFIVVGGIGYMTSAGDASKAKKAKDTILYAAIGLIIAALTFVIVNFIVDNLIK